MNKMYFKNSSHEYIFGKEKYTSFSSLIKLVEPEKDWDDIADKYAKKHSTKKTPLTKEEVLQMWAEKGRVAREKGTLFHALKENEDKENKAIYTDIIEDIKEILSLESLEDGIYPELCLYNNEFKACGMTDKAIIETIGGVKYVDLFDYKTSERIDTESFFNTRTQTYSTLKSPLNHIMDCNLYKYALQLSTYAYFLEKYNFTPRNLTVIHLVIEELPENEEVNSKYIIEFENKKYYVADEILYPVTYMKKEVKALLQYHKSKQRK
jgi:hypothetical protein